MQGQFARIFLNPILFAVVMLLLASCGGGGGGSNTNTTTAGTLSILAGTPGGRGYADGTGSEARFSYPYDIAVDSTGNVYVTDNYSIRKITASGVVSTFAGTSGVFGSADGIGTAASFAGPSGITIAADGNLYVADGQTIRKITPAGVVSTLAGQSGVGSSSDGVGAAARFNQAYGICADNAGNLYVTELIDSTIRKITLAGVVTTIAGTPGVSGSTDGIGAAASFLYPLGIDVDSSGNLYVADMGNNTIRKIDSTGTVTTFAGTAGTWGSSDGIGAAASFSAIVGIRVDSVGNLYLTDYSTLRKITPAGEVTTLAGSANGVGSTDGSGATASFRSPSGIAIDSNGNLYVADTGNATLRKVTPAGLVSTLAGLAAVEGNTDGLGAAASFSRPAGIAADSVGNLYVADTRNQSLRKISSGGTVSTLAVASSVVTPSATGSIDVYGQITLPSFASPFGIAVDNTGNLYVTDPSYAVIHKVTPAGELSTLAGSSGIFSSADGTGTAASFTNPLGIALDNSGNLYVADSQTVRKISPAGVVTTLAGTAGVIGSSDGLGSAASFSNLVGMAVDSRDQIYVTDAYAIRKISPEGLVTTLAGHSGLRGHADGLGVAARFRAPLGITLDNNGNLYVADGNSLRKITQAGLVSTVAGSGGPIAKVIPGVLPASLNRTFGLVASGSSLYLTDYAENLVMRIDLQ